MARGGLTIIAKFVQKFETTGFVKYKQKSVRPAVVKDDITVAEVLHANNLIANNTQYGESSVKKMSEDLDLSNTTV